MKLGLGMGREGDRGGYGEREGGGVLRDCLLFLVSLPDQQAGAPTPSLLSRKGREITAGSDGGGEEMRIKLTCITSMLCLLCHPSHGNVTVYMISVKFI